jgi:V/A-type H+-transporting ATPase subunit I
MTPAYWCWDPSSVVLISFAVFFAMILSDAGYGLLLGLVLLRFWKKLGRSEGGRRFRFVLGLLTASAVVYGMVVGSYFGITPQPDTILGRFHVLDMHDSGTMMMICVIIGALHIVVANVMDAVRYGWRAQALAPLGWAAMVVGGFLLGTGVMQQVDALTRWGGVVLGGGALLVFLFAGAGHPPLQRIVRGCLAFTQVTGAFGDVLSYLRLFALGLATASLALAFNGMAGDIREAVPGVGLLFALLILIVGHALNFVLGLSSGVIHGLRLNVIEFFKWGVPQEGRLFRPFKRKDNA